MVVISVSVTGAYHMDHYHFRPKVELVAAAMASQKRKEFLVPTIIIRTRFKRGVKRKEALCLQRGTETGHDAVSIYKTSQTLTRQPHIN